MKNATQNSESIVVRNDAGDVIGWVSRGGCENKHCNRAVKEGREWHATSRGVHVLFADNHFVTRDDAMAWLRKSIEFKGRRVVMTKTERARLLAMHKYADMRVDDEARAMQAKGLVYIIHDTVIITPLGLWQFDHSFHPLTRANEITAQCQ